MKSVAEKKVAMAIKMTPKISPLLAELLFNKKSLFVFAFPRQLIIFINLLIIVTVCPRF